MRIKIFAENSMMIISNTRRATLVVANKGIVTVTVTVTVSVSVTVTVTVEQLVPIEPVL